MSPRKHRVRAADRPNDGVSAELSAATGLPWRNYGGPVWKSVGRSYTLRRDTPAEVSPPRYRLICQDEFHRDLAEHLGSLEEIIAQVKRIEYHGLNLKGVI